MLGDSEISQIKQQLLAQIDSTFPEDKKEFAKQQILSMNNEQFEQFLIQNNLLKTSDAESNQVNPGQTNCIFCLIVQGQIPSYKIAENSESIAVLEINPISKGHTIVIPRQHLSSEIDLPDSAFKLAKQIAKSIKEKLNPKDISIVNSKMFNHVIINIIPIYDKEHIGSERKKASEAELQELQRILFQSAPVQAQAPHPPTATERGVLEESEHHEIPIDREDVRLERFQTPRIGFRWRRQN